MKTSAATPSYLPLYNIKGHSIGLQAYAPYASSIFAWNVRVKTIDENRVNGMVVEEQ